MSGAELAFIGAMTASAGASVYLATANKPHRPNIAPSAKPPELVSEQAQEGALRLARQRRGLGSTLLTGEMDGLDTNKKQLLGS